MVVEMMHSMIPSSLTKHVCCNQPDTCNAEINQRIFDVVKQKKNSNKKTKKTNSFGFKTYLKRRQLPASQIEYFKLVAAQLG